MILEKYFPAVSISSYSGVRKTFFLKNRDFHFYCITRYCRCI